MAGCGSGLRNGFCWEEGGHGGGKGSRGDEVRRGGEGGEVVGDVEGCVPLPGAGVASVASCFISQNVFLIGFRQSTSPYNRQLNVLNQK